MERIIERIVWGVVVIAVVYLLTGCGTIIGFGEDLVWVGSLRPQQQQTLEQEQ